MVSRGRGGQGPDTRRTALRRGGIVLLVVGVAVVALAASASAAHKSSPDVHEVKVIRVYFNDYSQASRWDRGEVEDIFNDSLDSLFQNTSYGDVGWTANVTDLHQLPKNRAQYIDDKPKGDLSENGKFRRVLDDAIATLTNAERQWLADADAVAVLMAETGSQFHRGQAKTCNFNLDVGGGTTRSANIGCGIFSENPTASETSTWGRMAHELAHMVQDGGPAHPSNYNNSFELLDANYPGHISAFEKSDDQYLGEWMPDSHVASVIKDEGGSQCLRAIEYDAGTAPNPMILEVPVTDNSYYLVSYHQAIRGDQLDPIPDEGVLIEKVVEGRDQWSILEGNPTIDDLWQKGQTFTNSSDGISIEVDPQRGDDESLCVHVSYDPSKSEPDVGTHKWREPPGNTWETTDIWVDSPVNGYDNYRYGKWSDGAGGTVPKGNGDDPALGQKNRLYVRVRNFGDEAATDVVVHLDRTDPPGLGINGADGWSNIGTVDKSDFPGLGNIPPGGTVDVYVEWTPSEDLQPDDVEDGTFAFHTCIRVRMDSVSGEVVTSNQDGDEEQENIGHFEAPSTDSGSVDAGLNLKNPDPTDSQWYNLDFQEDTPPGWDVDVNNGDYGVEVPAGASKFIPVRISHPSGGTPGDSFGVDVRATTLESFVHAANSSDRHLAYQAQGGTRFEAQVVKPVDIECSAQRVADGIRVTGRLLDTGRYGQSARKVQAISGSPDAVVDPDSWAVGDVEDGTFAFTFEPESDSEKVACLFAGTKTLSRASSGFVPVEEPSGADLSLEKEVSPSGPVSAGDTLTYTITATNHGPEPAPNVVVSDTLPSGADLVDVTATAGSCTSSPLECDLGDLSSGTSETVTVTANATASDPGENRAMVTSDADDPDPSNNEAAAEAGGGNGAPGFGTGLAALAAAGAALAARSRRP